MEKEYNSIEEIKEKARVLGTLVHQHPLTKTLIDCRAELQADSDSFQLLQELIALGQNIDAGLEVPNQESWEYLSIQQRLDKNPLVTKYIRAQRAYLNMIRTIQEHMIPSMVTIDD